MTFDCLGLTSRKKFKNSDTAWVERKKNECRHDSDSEFGFACRIVDSTQLAKRKEVLKWDR